MNKALLFLCVAAAGCGVSEAQLDESSSDTSSEVGELGTTSRSYVVFRHDQRRCASPQCGGWWVHDVNRASVREVYVPAFDFSSSNLAGLPEQQERVTSGGEFEVVLYGKLGALKNGLRDFVVTTAWRGMPGVKFTEVADTFYSVEGVDVRCITAPCPSLKARRLQTTSTTLFHDVDTAPAAMPYVDQNWMTSRIVNKGALVAGRFVNGAQVGAGTEQVLKASQVFVKIPDQTQSCGRPSLALCPSPRRNVWARDDNRCVMPAGCAAPGACAAFVPACADGYSLQSWTGGPFACQQYACDPSWL